MPTTLEACDVEFWAIILNDDDLIGTELAELVDAGSPRRQIAMPNGSNRSSHRRNRRQSSSGGSIVGTVDASGLNGWRRERSPPVTN